MFLYRFSKDFFHNYSNRFKHLANLLSKNLKRNKYNSINKAIENWNFNDDFKILQKFMEYDYDYFEAIGNRFIKEDKKNPKGYAFIKACYEYKRKKSLCDVGPNSLAVGNELLDKGNLTEARLFFFSMKKIFPEIYEPYAILYDMIYLKQKEYREAPNYKYTKNEKKMLILSFSVWGDKYIKFFNNYCIPCILADGNLPAVAKLRNISIDIYAHSQDIIKIKSQTLFKSLSDLCNINFIEFQQKLVTCEGYKRNDSAFRYNIYGGFHHLSIERARSIGADVMCLGPDNIYSNGSFFNYVKFIEEGYNAVFFTATRVQSEFLEPVLDTIKDLNSGTLPITSDEMVNFSTQYIHHSFLQYIVTDKNTPVWRSAFFIPYKHGFYIRSYHYHPVIISALILDRSKEFNWNYRPVDSNLKQVLFFEPKNLETIKVIEDSRDGIMCDLAYGSPGLHNQNITKFSDEFLDMTFNNFNDHHFWNFKFTVNYRMENEIKNIRAYLYNKDGKLVPTNFPLTKIIDDLKKRIDDWYNKKRLD
jgi:hypothetical protein